MGAGRELVKGLWSENPIFRIALGLCPALAVTTSAVNGIGMGLATAFVLLCSSVVISSLRSWVPEKIMVPAYLIVIGTFVTIADLVMDAYAHPLREALGIYIPLIVVNCVIMGRVRGYARRNGVLHATLDGIGVGLGFTLTIFVIGAIRETLGNGTLFGAKIFPASYGPFFLMTLPPGAFIVLGLMIGGANRLEMHLARRAGREPSFQRGYGCGSSCGETSPHAR
jgi:electron transport complex protein RnfE